MDERLKILVNSWIRKMDTIGMRRSRKFCAVRPQERLGHAFSRFRRAVSMKKMVEKRLKCNIASVT